MNFNIYTFCWEGITRFSRDCTPYKKISNIVERKKFVGLFHQRGIKYFMFNHCQTERFINIENQFQQKVGSKLFKLKKSKKELRFVWAILMHLGDCL